MTNKPMMQDKVIDILKGSPSAKRAKRKAQVELTLTISNGEYTIQLNGKTVEQAQGDESMGRKQADLRAERIRAMGKTVTITVY